MLWLTQSNMLAIVVLLPLPVTPARRTIPWSNLQSSSMMGGRYSPSKFGINRSTFRETIPGLPICINMFTRNRHGSPSLNHHIGKVAATRILIDLPVPIADHRVEQFPHPFLGDGLHLQLAQRPADAQDRRLADLHVQVGAVVLDELPIDLVDFVFASFGRL